MKKDNNEENNKTPEYICEFLNSLYVISKINSKAKNNKKFNFLCILIPNKADTAIEHTLIGNSETDLDTEVLLSLLWKHAEILDEKINLASKQSIQYPKPNQIQNNYFGEFQNQLEVIYSDLEYIYKKFNYSYLFILHKNDCVKFLYKMKQDIATYHSESVHVLIEYARGHLSGLTVQEVTESFMDDDSEVDEEAMNKFFNDLEGNNEDFKENKSAKKNILEDDEDEFNKH